jgi:hypothetical protein
MMQLNHAEPPNYFFFAHALINFLRRKIETGAIRSTSDTFSLFEIYAVFGQNFAATTANLEAIVHLANHYYLADQPKQHLIISHHIDAQAHTLHLVFDAPSLQAVQSGAELHAPDANNYN